VLKIVTAKYREKQRQRQRRSVFVCEKIRERGFSIVQVCVLDFSKFDVL